jgi:hypothetical protein
MHTPSLAELREEAERQLLLATIRLARALNGKSIQVAPLKDRASVLGVAADRYLKFAAAHDRADDPVRLVFEEEEEPTHADHPTEDAARGAEADLGEPRPLSGLGVWPPLRQDRAG